MTVITVYRKAFSTLVKRICIIGIQRSGTTLLGNIFRVRPDVTYYGDGTGVPALRDYYLPDKDIGVYKVTQITQRPDLFEESVKRLFCYRDIIPTVSSMKKLGWLDRGRAGNELKDCVENHPSEKLVRYAKDMMSSFDYETKLHRVGALVVAMKMTFLKEHTNILPVKYEDLVQNPSLVLSKICNFCDIDFNPIMLEHEKHLEGELHGTKHNRKIDLISLNKSDLTEREVKEILEIKKEVMSL